MKITTIKFISFIGKLTFAVILAVSGVAVASAQGSGWSTTSIDIREFSFTPSTIDTTNGSQTVTITVRVTDTERDFWQMNVYFRSPQSHTNYGFGGSNLGIEDRISGNGRDGVYRKTVTIHQYAEAGTWEVSSIHVYDGTLAYYRWREFFTSDLVARGFATQLHVTNTNEAVPPEISDFSFTPTAINTTNRRRDVTITLRARDETSGVSSIYVSFTNPPGCYIYDDECTTLFYLTVTGADRISGDDKDGVYRVVATVPQNYPIGTYSARVTAVDAVQNRKFLSASELSALGYPSQLQVSASMTVTRNDDRNNATCVPGDCSLREAVNASNASATDDTISFASGLTNITLTNEIVINNAGALIINGPAANVLTIDGGTGTNRIFYTNEANVKISGVTLRGGKGTGAAGNGDGGAVYAFLGSLMIDAVHIIGNGAGSILGRGGGVFYSGGTHSITNSTISGNGAYEGGGICIFGLLDVANSTISGNSAYPYAGEGGGGIYSQGAVTFRNVTVTNNSASFGGGITGGGLFFGNTIVAWNNAFKGDGDFHSASGKSSGGNLFGSSSDSIQIVYQPTDIRDTNPLLGVLQDNGGATPTHKLLAGSPAIERGLNSLVSPLAPDFDQRRTGFARIRDGNGDSTATVDIGAFEMQTVARTKFDYNGDGKADVSVFRPGTNDWHILQSSGGIRVQGWGLAGDKMAPADFDGDGKTDLAVFRESDSNWYILNSSNNTVTTAGWGLPGDLPVPFDYGGDGKADIAVYRPSEGKWYRRDSDGLIHVFEWGLADDRPAPADFTGDGRTDMAVFRPGSGTWHVLSSSDFSVTTTNWGVNGDVPVAADYSGDGKADFVVFRPSDLTWYRRNSDDGSLHFITWGLAGDIPVPGDYDGDGKTDLAVYRPSNGTWYIFGSQAGIYSQPFGLQNDLPTPNAFSY